MERKLQRQIKNIINDYIIRKISNNKELNNVSKNEKNENITETNLSNSEDKNESENKTYFYESKTIQTDGFLPHVCPLHRFHIVRRR